MSNVRTYTDKELLNKAKSLPSFKGFPKGYYIIGAQSLEDAFNKYDDKFYLYYNEGVEFTNDINLQKFIKATSGTTNAGANGLLKYDTYNKEGVAVIKTNEVYYYVWRYGLHKGKMPALRQIKTFLISRDGNKNTKIEEGKSLPAICGINFHANNYDLSNKEIKEIIGGWSLGCQVCNNLTDYNLFIDRIKAKKLDVSYILLKEF